MASGSQKRSAIDDVPEGTQKTGSTGYSKKQQSDRNYRNNKKAKILGMENELQTVKKELESVKIEHAHLKGQLYQSEKEKESLKTNVRESMDKVAGAAMVTQNLWEQIEMLPTSGAKERGSTSASTEVKEVNPPNLTTALKPSGMEMEMTQLAYNKLKQRYTASQESHAREIFSLTDSHAEEVTVMTVNHHQELENLRQDLREALAREENLKQELARIRDQEFTSIDYLIDSNIYRSGV